MTLEPLTRDDAEQVRIWRNAPEMQAVLRTSKRLTHDEQQDWYTREIANRESHTRYWALVNDSTIVCHKRDGTEVHAAPSDAPVRHLLGYGGIEHISWENRNGEISLLIDPERYRQKLGSDAVAMFLDQAFNYLNLNAVFAECYSCGATGFWEKMRLGYHGDYAFLADTKYYNGVSYGSEVTTFTREEYNESDMRYPGKG